jgi:hypothetical protein
VTLPAPAGLPEWSPAAPEGSRCAAHPSNPAVKVCERCGDFSCELCAVPVEGRVYCARCFGLLCDRGSFRFAQQDFYAPRLAASLSGLSWLGVFVPGLSLVAAALGITVALGALKRIREKPDLPGRGTAIGAIVSGGLSLLLTVVVAGVLLWGMLRG